MYSLNFMIFIENILGKKCFLSLEPPLSKYSIRSNNCDTVNGLTPLGVKPHKTNNRPLYILYCAGEYSGSG